MKSLSPLPVPTPLHLPMPSKWSDISISGNVLQFTNMKTGEHTYQRSVSGVGLGAVAIHPSNNFFAVGELGPNAVINIFSYPECQLVRVLKGGSVQGYASLGFNSVKSLFLLKLLCFTVSSFKGLM
jgi:hypothetical protein